jgi:hypothetical protein
LGVLLPYFLSVLLSLHVTHYSPRNSGLDDRDDDESIRYLNFHISPLVLILFFRERDDR